MRRSNLKNQFSAAQSPALPSYNFVFQNNANVFSGFNISAGQDHPWNRHSVTKQPWLDMDYMIGSNNKGSLFDVSATELKNCSPIPQFGNRLNESKT